MMRFSVQDRKLAPRLIALAMVALALVALSDPAAARRVGGASLFGSHEVKSSRMSLFPKWRGTLSRYFDERKLADAPCTSTVFNRCHLREWKKFLKGLRGETRAEQIKLVNQFMNRHRYIIDPRNYGVPDYWATPRQFLTRDGDCEDYAIAKYLSLRALGFKPRQMRIVVLQDLNLSTAHAVLVVYQGRRKLILDNQIKMVVDHAVIRHYRPIYSINEEAWWLHRM
ncbi:MAG: transglutaminase-like cysteine peptidase [Alphaproteobacteria bacterium]